jgi:hypothetical protein
MLLSVATVRSPILNRLIVLADRQSGEWRVAPSDTSDTSDTSGEWLESAPIVATEIGIGVGVEKALLPPSEKTEKVAALCGEAGSRGAYADPAPKDDDY